MSNLYHSEFWIQNTRIAENEPTYFIADIGANHDGDLSRAKDLIWLAKEAGADCAKFQHFLADGIVSDVGFSQMKEQKSHQATWKKSVREVYDQYHTKRDWTEALITTCEEASITFMTTPYDLAAVRLFSSRIPAYKIGSGDITYTQLILEIASQGAPVLLATGASSMHEVIEAVEVTLSKNPSICLMQCNTNYTGDSKNFEYVNLNVLKTFASKWPGMPLGLSDHTPGHSAVLGAITLGARVIEKHFTDDNSRQGPDHSFALNPETWRAMVMASRELEAALGDGIKRVEANEEDTVVVQRRALRATKDLPMGHMLQDGDFEALRPCEPDNCLPSQASQIIGKCLQSRILKGEAISWQNLSS